MFVICGQGCHKSVYDLCMNLYSFIFYLKTGNVWLTESI